MTTILHNDSGVDETRILEWLATNKPELNPGLHFLWVDINPEPHEPLVLHCFQNLNETRGSWGKLLNAVAQVLR